MVIKSLNKIIRTFTVDYGKAIICQDGHPDNYWRKQVFPHYKASRRRTHEENDINWTLIFESMDYAIKEIIENIGSRCVMLQDAEADDVIAVLTMYIESLEKVLIVSADKDFIQLQRFPNVSQYSPLQKMWIRNGAPNAYLKQHIMLGDRGDGIPNFLSPDDAFVNKIRQTSIYKKKLEEWTYLPPEKFCDDNMLVGYNRNKRLIDFNEIPDDIRIRILEQFNQQEKI